MYIKEDDSGGQVYSESGELLYRFERITGILPGYWIYQQHQEVGNMRREFGSVSKVGIIVGDEKKDIIGWNPLDQKAGMKFERCLWRVTGDFTRGSIKVTDSRDRQLATVFPEGSGHTVSLLREKDLYMVLMAWLAAGMVG